MKPPSNKSGRPSPAVFIIYHIVASPKYPGPTISEMMYSMMHPSNSWDLPYTTYLVISSHSCACHGSNSLCAGSTRYPERFIYSGKPKFLSPAIRLHLQGYLRDDFIHDRAYDIYEGGAQAFLQVKFNVGRPTFCLASFFVSFSDFVFVPGISFSGRPIFHPESYHSETHH